MKKTWCFKNDVTDVEALVEKAVGLTGAVENAKLRSVRTANGVLMFAADYLLTCRRLGMGEDNEPTTEEVNRVLGRGKSRLLCSSSDYLKLLPSKRAGIRSVIYAMILCYRDEPHVPDDGAALKEGMAEKYTTPILDCQMLVSRTISRLMSTELSGAAGMDEITMSQTGDAVLTHAADIVLGYERDRLDRVYVSTDAPHVVEKALIRADVSAAQYERLAGWKRDMILRIVDDMLYEHVPDFDPEPDDLIDITAENCDLALAEFAREDATAQTYVDASETSPFDGVAINPSEVLPFHAYEVLVGTGKTGWRRGVFLDRKWLDADSYEFLAFQGSVTCVRIPAVHIGKCVKQTMDCYKTLLPRDGEEETDARCRNVICHGANWLACGVEHDNLKAAAPLTDRSDSWWRVHDAILRGYYRFKIHVPDPEPSEMIAA